jgi:hypothetical protein
LTSKRLSEHDVSLKLAVVQWKQLLKELIEQLEMAPPTVNVFLGLFAQEPELVDQVVESIMQAREQHPLRQSDG